MNRKIVLWVLLLFSFCVIKAQKRKLPLEIKKGHLFSEWRINNSVKTRVMLETGFPKIVINETFAKKYLTDIVEMKKAPVGMNIALWGTQKKQKISYVIKDSLVLNGRKIFIDAVVADMSASKSWKNRDMVFPLRDLSEEVEINIKDRYMIIGKELEDLSNHLKLNVKYDKKLKGFYLPVVLDIFDTLQVKERLRGKFLLDLGAPNAIFVNRDRKEVEEFVKKSDRMLLKDRAKFTPKSHVKLAVLMPQEIHINDIILRDEHMVALKLSGKQSKKYVGVIGNRFFNKFIVIFDFKNNNVYLNRNSNMVDIIK